MPGLDQLGPEATKLARNHTFVLGILARHRPNMVQRRPNLACIDQTWPAFNPLWLDIGQLRPISSKFWPPGRRIDDAPFLKSKPKRKAGHASGGPTPPSAPPLPLRSAGTIRPTETVFRFPYFDDRSLVGGSSAPTLPGRRSRDAVAQPRDCDRPSAAPAGSAPVRAALRAPLAREIPRAKMRPDSSWRSP